MRQVQPSVLSNPPTSLLQRGYMLKLALAAAAGFHDHTSIAAPPFDMHMGRPTRPVILRQRLCPAGVPT